LKFNNFEYVIPPLLYLWKLDATLQHPLPVPTGGERRYKGKEKRREGIAP
jgi:hypothetical protein